MRKQDRRYRHYGTIIALIYVAMVVLMASLSACSDDHRVLLTAPKDTLALSDTLVVVDTVFVVVTKQLAITVTGDQGSKVFVNGEFVDHAPVVVWTAQDTEIEVRQNR